MYEYKGVALLNEYLRNMMSYAVTAGIIAALGMNIFTDYIFRRTFGNKSKSMPQLKS